MTLARRALAQGLTESLQYWTLKAAAGGKGCQMARRHAMAVRTRMMVLELRA